VTEQLARTKHGWNDADERKLIYSQETPSRCLFVHEKRHMDWAGIEPDSRGKRLTSHGRDSVVIIMVTDATRNAFLPR
jgi:hypothetical protein